ncbi:hypothetical protein [Chitinophaga sp.]|uniref:hypothetical protein n=1 Tax=Chitinophaga sp. TaxID=1869181 RepID=UPI0031DF0635
MTRYWFEFDIPLVDAHNLPSGLLIGCGITAYNYEDAISILKDKVFKEQVIPVIKRMIENVDIRTLDQGHVIPNMTPPVARGVWFPYAY